MKISFVFFASLLLSTAAVAQNLSGTDLRPVEDVNNVTDLTLDSLHKANTVRPVPGSSRIGTNPVLFLVGNSTMRTGTLGNGNNGQWGWGFYAGRFFDENRITVENHALGGTSSRTFYNNLWPEVRKGIRPGDWVLIELGHNDNGPFDSGRARATIKGTGKDSLVVTIKETGKQETVYSYGEYMRRFIADVRAAGGYPVLFSLTPRNAWTEDGKIARVNETFGLWAWQVAEEEGVPFVDLNEITARKFEQFGPDKVNYMFYLDKIHTSEYGAAVNARSAAEGIRECPGLELKQYLKPLDLPVAEGLRRREGRPVVFITGDSTVKNEDRDEDGMWGWGSQAVMAFDTTKITPVNCAMAGRSCRTFIEEGRWDKVYNSILPGDFVLIQFGHNDVGDIEKGKARAEIRGTSDSSHVYLMEKTQTYKVVYTFGWYLRKFIGDVREKGGIPVLVSFTPRNIWKDGRMERRTDHKGVWEWTRRVAEETGIDFIDLHNLTGEYLQKKGEKKAKDYYNKDHTHTSKKGAQLNASMIRKGLKDSNSPLKKYLK